MKRKIFFMTHPRRFNSSEFERVLAHQKRENCSSCSKNVSRVSAPLCYYWDYEFGDPEKAFREKWNCFWGGGVYLITTPEGRQAFKQLDLPFAAQPTQQVKTREVGHKVIVEPVTPKLPDLSWITTTNEVTADIQLSKNTVCEECGIFLERPQQVTRLVIPEQPGTELGVFTVKQNRGGPIFVTEAVKSKIEGSPLKGIRFSPAGHVV